MATAPSAPEYNQPTVQYDALPNVSVPIKDMNAPLEAFGGGASRAAEDTAFDKFGDEIATIGKDEQQKADDAAAIDAYNKTMSYKQGLLYGTQATDTDPATPGALNIHGKDALNLSGDYSQKFDDFTSDVSSTMTPNQQALYTKLASQQKEDLMGTIERHTYQETQNYNDQVVQNGLAVNKNEAVLNYMDSDKVDDAVDMQQRLIRDNAQKKGLAPEELQDQLQTTTSDTYKAVINRMLSNQQDQQAKQYYDDHRDDFTGADASVLEKSLEEGNLRGSSQRIVDSMEAQKMSPDQAMDYFKTIQDPDLRDKVQERYKNDQLEQKRITEDNQTQLYQAAYNQMKNDKSLDNVAPNVMAAMTPAQQSGLQSSLKQIIEGVPATTDIPTWYKLNQMATTDRQNFLQANLLQYDSKLSPTDFKYFAKMQSDANKGDTRALDGFMSKNQVVNDVLTSAGVNPKSNREESAQFANSVDQQVQQYEQQTGKRATNDDVRNIANRQMLNVTTSEHWYGDTTKHLFQMGPNDDVVVPQTETAKITAALQKHGQPVNDTAIKNIYIKKLKGG